MNGSQMTGIASEGLVTLAEYVRRRLDMPKYRLAAKAGLTPADVSRLLSLRTIGYPKQLARLAAALDIPDPSLCQLLVNASTGEAA